MIIGLKGSAGSGKSTFVEAVVATLKNEKRIISIAFSDVLKRYLQELFDFTDNQLWGPSSARVEELEDWVRPNGSKLTAREALQTLGTDWGRARHPDVWVRYTQKVISKLLNTQEYAYSAKTGLYPSKDEPLSRVIVVTDVRFQNEYSALKDLGAYIVEIARDFDKQGEVWRQHASEASYEGMIPDILIHNDGSLEGYKDTCVEVFAGILKQRVAQEEQQLVNQKFEEICTQIPQREEDIKKGKLMRYDLNQEDIPPWKRKN